MKKVFVLSLFAMAVLISQAWAQEHCKEGGLLLFCQWDEGCYTINNQYEPNIGKQCSDLIAACKNDGVLYTGSSVLPALAAAPYGKGANCANEGLTKAAGGNEKCGYYCLWDTGCKEIATDINGINNPQPILTCTDAIAACDKDGERYSSSTCTGTPVTGPSGPFCYWAPDEYNDNKCTCAKVNGEAATAENCTADFGVIVESCTGYCGSTPPNPNPIIKFTPASQALIVAPYGRSLHISSAREAIVSLYDMSGARVYSGRVRAGNSVFSLQTVPAGSYYAVVQSGSDAKKVAVILK